MTTGKGMLRNDGAMQRRLPEDTHDSEKVQATTDERRLAKKSRRRPGGEFRVESGE
jgi:hypothetical protein